MLNLAMQLWWEQLLTKLNWGIRNNISRDNKLVLFFITLACSTVYSVIVSSVDKYKLSYDYSLFEF